MSKYDPFAFSAVFVSTGAIAAPPRDDRSLLEIAITKLIRDEFATDPVRGDALLAKVVDAIHEDDRERNYDEYERDPTWGEDL